jgi:hypothetical protein
MELASCGVWVGGGGHVEHKGIDVLGWAWLAQRIAYCLVTVITSSDDHPRHHRDPTVVDPRQFMLTRCFCGLVRLDVRRDGRGIGLCVSYARPGFSSRPRG